MLQRTAEYALRTVIWMAREPGCAQTSHQIAKGTRVPPRYLYKVLQTLVREGMLRSQPGPGGGFTLERDPDKISLLDVVDAIGPIGRICSCPLGLKSHKDLCPLHRHLDRAYAVLEEELARTTVGEVIRERTPFPSLLETKKSGQGRMGSKRR
ncbi:MAG: Rrf2 family transcriptional regulator [Pirellulales bacterium]|nr:Rrf2 family transcriptional regulator [Pirellulales bacterium]